MPVDTEKIKALAQRIRQAGYSGVREARRSLLDREKVRDRILPVLTTSSGKPIDILSNAWKQYRDPNSSSEAYINSLEDRVDDIKDRGERYDYELEEAEGDLRMAKQHEDAKRLYLGYGAIYGTMEPSPYQPTIGTADNPYQVNPLLRDDEFEWAVLPAYTEWKTRNKSDYGYSVEDRGKTALLKNFPYLSNATMSEGHDDKGHYISLYDIWDYNTSISGKPGDNIGWAVGGKPVEIYQRYYLDDWLDIPEKDRGNHFLAPATITEYVDTGEGEYRKGGNLFLPGGNLKEKAKEKAFAAVSKALQNEKLVKKVVDFPEKHPKLFNAMLPEIRRRLYNNVEPYGYNDFGLRIDDAVSGKGPEYPSRLYARDDIWAEYLQIPKEERHKYGDYPVRVVPSKYRPTIGDETSTEYKALDLPNEDKFNLIFDALRDGNKNRVTGNNNHGLTDYLASHTVGTGFDDKGQYVSYYDLWDINPKFGESAQAMNQNILESEIGKKIGKDNVDASLGIGKPIHFYDRIYLNDYFGVQPILNPDEYYGGWIRPAFIEDSRDYDSKITGDEYYSFDGSIPIRVKKYGGKVHRFDDGSWLRRALGFMQDVGQQASENSRDARTAMASSIAQEIAQTEGSEAAQDYARKYLKANAAGIASGVAAGVGGAGIAEGIDFAGKAAMPSTFLRGAATYLPYAAEAGEAATQIGPYLDAAALSYWSAKAGQEAINAAKDNRTLDAVAYGTVAALPVAMPLGMKAWNWGNNIAKNVKTPLRITETAPIAQETAARTSTEEALKIPATVVNEDGSINNTELAKAYRNILKEIRSRGDEVKLWPKQQYPSSNGLTSLKEHIAGVVKTAQEIPVPAGSSRAELVRTALAHDIGKLITGQESANAEVIYHPGMSVSLLKSTGYPEFQTQTIETAIQHHMDDRSLPIYGAHGNTILKDPLGLGHDETLNYDLLHALQAADVARGASYDEAAMRFPQLFTYNKEIPFDVKLFNGDEIEQLEKVINPILKRNGYPTVHNREELAAAIKRHRSLFRGVRDPAKDASGYNPQNMIPTDDAQRNYFYASRLAKAIYGKDTPETRMLVSLGNIPSAPTGYGRQDLFNLSKGSVFSRFTQHKPDILSKRLKVSPKEQDALYVSVSPELLKTYSTASNSRDVMPAKVTLPFDPIREGESLVSFLERGEWQLYNGAAIHGSGNPMSTWQMFEEPYRLQTGRSLQTDMAKELPEGLKKFERYGHEIVDTNAWNGTFTKMQQKLANASYALSQLSSEYGIKTSKILPEISPGVYLIRDKKAFTKLADYLALFRGKSAEKLAKAGYANQKMAKAYDAAVRRLYNHDVTDAKSIFEKREEVDRIGKYIFNKATLKRIINDYFNTINESKNTARVSKEFKAYLTDPKHQLEFMRKKGLHPLWEMPSFGKTEIFSTNGAGHQWGARPTSRNFAPSTSPAQGVIIGKQGEKVLDVTPLPLEDFKNWMQNFQNIKKVGSGNRDAGSRYLGEDPMFSVTRKTFGLGGQTLLRDYATGGKIRIKPSKRGTFTAAANKHGKSVQAFASQVLAHKENYSPAMVKKARFAKAAASWQHGDGGLIERFGADAVRKALEQRKKPG